MHELSLCQSVLRVLQEQARLQRFTRVKTVYLEIGALAAVEKQAMQFGFDVVCKGSLAQGARLEIIEIPGQAWCRQCKATVPVRQRFEACRQCGGYDLRLVAGDEMKVQKLEVD